ncbi:MAG: hypothetical protein DRO99_04155 [Candidatus Aenigmatarchaeota archaeon]|nr:MAG: hypothetical protein DRO99_04155 [Candidatus Aenigmarchaeota archaeon]
MVTVESALGRVWSWLMGFLQNLVPEYILPNIPVIIQVAVLLAAGYISGKLAKLIVTKLMSAIGLKRITTRTWAESVIKITGYSGTIVELIGDLVKWIVYVAFLGMIIQTIGFPGVADIFTQTAAFMPRFIGAILIIVIGFIIADFFGKVFEEAGNRFLKEDLLASLSGGVMKYSISIVVVIMALSLIGIDSLSLTIMFSIILIAFVISVVIGLRDILPSYSAGFSIRGDIKVGDKVKIGKYSGVVEKIEPLSMVLRSGKKRIIVPNGVVMKEAIEKF